jgi:hypothetical protein
MGSFTTIIPFYANFPMMYPSGSMFHPKRSEYFYNNKIPRNTIPVKNMKIPTKILFLCCFLALALIPLQTAALSVQDNPHTLVVDGITYQSTSSSGLLPAYSGIRPPSGAVTSGCHEGCLCSVEEFVYTGDPQSDVYPAAWSDKIFRIFQSGSWIPGQIWDRIHPPIVLQSRCGW